MNPQSGQHVKCVLQNGTVAEGIVEEWSNNAVQLKSLDGDSVLIITHPSEDIRLIKILLSKPQKKKIELKKDLEEIHKVANPYDPDARKSLAELHIDLAKQERKIITEKLKEHRPGIQGSGKVEYGYPRFNQKSRLK